MSMALSRYLRDFSAEPPPSAAIPDASFDEMPLFPETPAAPPVDIEAERREAYALGHEAATQELQQSHQAELAAVMEAHRHELDALRAQFEEQAAERVAAGLTQIATLTAQAVSTEAALALAPIMTEALTVKAVHDLADLVTTAMLDGTAAQVTVSGPRALFEILQARLGEHGALLRHVEATDVDLTVTIGDSVLVTRMSAWAGSLRKILE